MKLIETFLYSSRLQSTFTQCPTNTVSLSLDEKDKQVAQAQLTADEKEHKKVVERLMGSGEVLAETVGQLEDRIRDILRDIENSFLFETRKGLAEHLKKKYLGESK